MILFYRFLITTLFLILIYIVYRSEIYWEGKLRNVYLIYYIVTLLVIFFSIIVTLFNEKIKKYLTIIFISIIFSFYFFELSLIYDKKKTNPKFYDNRTRFEFYEHLKKNNLNVTITTPPANFLYFQKEMVFFSFSGISKTKTINCNENGYFSTYQSDRYGFNNPDKEWDSKEVEYFLVGDSFTHGACVNSPNDIASVLRRYSNKNVLNLGYGGNGPLIEYATLREYLKTNTKNVLWLYFEKNDLTDLEIELKNNILIKYLANIKFTQDLKFKQTQVDQFLSTYVEIERKREGNFYLEIINFIKLVKIRSLLIKPQPPPLPPPEFKTILKLANELVGSNSGKLYFIYLPDYNRYTKHPKVTYNKQQIKKIVSDLNIEFIDIDEEVFKKVKNPLKFFPFESDGHYNVEGYKKVALKIYERTK